MPDRLRLLCVIGSLGGGGSERQIVNLLRHLDRARFAPALYLVERAGELLPEVPGDVPVFAYSDRTRTARWNYPGRIHRLQVADLADVIRREKMGIVYDRTFQATLIAAPAARRAGVKRVSVIVSDPRSDVEHMAGRFLRMKRLLLARACRTADRVVAVSEGVRRSAIGWYRIPFEQIVTIPNPVDIERIDRLAAEPGPQFEPGRFHIVSAGRLQEEKGYRFLLEAVRELVRHRGHREVCLHLLGQGRQETELRAFVHDEGLEEYVRFEGYQANPYPWFRSAQLVCLSSLYEGLPNVLLEAMACRVPVLATDCPSGPREILDDGLYGELVPPGSSAALAEALDDCIRNQGRWLARVPAARAHVEAHFALERRIGDLERLLTDVSRQRHPAASD